MRQNLREDSRAGTAPPNGLLGRVWTIPRGPIDTQICVPHFGRFYREKKRPVSEKAPVAICLHQRLDSFQNCARVAQICARVAENCARVAVVISVQFDFLARNLVPNQKPSDPQIIVRSSKKARDTNLCTNWSR